MKYLNTVKNKKWTVKIPVIIGCAFVLLYSCVNLVTVIYDDLLDANQVATFTMKVQINPAENQSDNRLIIAYLVPKSWKAVENTQVTYINSLDPGIVKTMSPVPEGTFPKNGDGLTWDAALRNRFGFGPNVLDEMEWIAYWSDEVSDVVKSQNMDIDVKIEMKIGPDNMRVKLGFFVNHNNDGLSTNGDHFKVYYTDCIEIANGEGLIMDFCELHFNMVQPSNATKEDIVTIKFLGDIEPNVLDDAEAVYLSVVAYTDAGKTYTVNARNEKTKMQKESLFGRSYSLTFWPGDYFGIPESESITSIEYFFTNEDGSLWLKETSDSGGGAETPFLTPFICK
jgi:hypothetical protein